MRLFRYIFLCLAAACAIACSKDEDKGVNAFTIYGDEYAAQDAGFYNAEGTSTTLQFLLDGGEIAEIVVPEAALGQWFVPQADGSSWRLMLLHTYLGSGSGMNQIDEAKIFVNPMGEECDRKQKFEVRFEVTLTDGRTASGHFRGEIDRKSVWFVN